MNMLYRLLIPALLLITAPVHAYIGPGLGAGTVGVILGVLGSIVLALFAIFWYPIKRMLNRGKAKKAEESPEETGDDTSKEPEKSSE